jgi:hypothetical protein
MDYVKEFENDCRIRGLTKQTILTYKCNVSDFLAATHEYPAAVTQGDLRDHLRLLFLSVENTFELQQFE